MGKDQIRMQVKVILQRGLTIIGEKAGLKQMIILLKLILLLNYLDIIHRILKTPFIQDTRPLLYTVYCILFPV